MGLFSPGFHARESALDGVPGALVPKAVHLRVLHRTRERSHFLCFTRTPYEEPTECRVPNAQGAIVYCIRIVQPRI